MNMHHQLQKQTKKRGRESTMQEQEHNPRMQEMWSCLKFQGQKNNNLLMIVIFFTFFVVMISSIDESIGKRKMFVHKVDKCLFRIVSNQWTPPFIWKGITFMSFQQIASFKHLRMCPKVRDKVYLDHITKKTTPNTIFFLESLCVQ